MGHDPAGWLGVDPKTGDVTTVKSPDRESQHVVDGVYTAILLAVDSGEAPPPQSYTVSALPKGSLVVLLDADSCFHFNLHHKKTHYS